MKVLIVRFSSIGDIVLATPVIRCVRQQLGAEVHVLTKHAFRSILEPNPYVGKVYSIQKHVGEVKQQLRVERYDAILDLHNNLRSLQVKWSLRARSFTFNKINWAKWLKVNLKIDRLPKVHIVERYMKPAEALGVAYDGQGLDYFIPREAEVSLPGTLGIAPGGYVAIAIGAAHATKRLPLEQLVALARGLTEPVVLLGGPGDAEIGAEVAAAAGAHVANTCGKLSLHQSASIAKQARHVITHDTGMMHIAAALRKPITAVWGNTIPGFGMYPFYPDGVQRHTDVEVAGLGCRPCSKIGHEACPKGHFRCMQNIEIAAILQAAQK